MEKIMSFYLVYNINYGFYIKENCTKYFKKHSYETNLDFVIKNHVIPQLMKLYYLKDEI